MSGAIDFLYQAEYNASGLVGNNRYVAARFAV